MSTKALISVEEYLATSYRPDCDYVDGQVEERNLGEWDHSSLQTGVAAYFFARRKEWGISVVVEQRVQVKPTRFRIPDVCVVLGNPGEQILTNPPFLCIEILSPEDRMSRVEERIDDYLAMGVPRLAARSSLTPRLCGDCGARPARSERRGSQDREPRARSTARRSFRVTLIAPRPSRRAASGSR